MHACALCREVGYKRRPLRVQWAKECAALHVCSLADLARTRERDLERHFEGYVRLPVEPQVEIKRSYAFVQFEDLEDAMYAMVRYVCVRASTTHVYIHAFQLMERQGTQMRTGPNHFSVVQNDIGLK
eukprot:1157951-Pelagomonas_calceolata.AAC.2